MVNTLLDFRKWKLGYFLILFCLVSCTEDTTAPVSGLNSTIETPSTVSRPLLLKTLPASWDENWFASAAIYNLDNDSTQEIIASRHSVLYVWNSDGTLRWRAPVGENSSSANDHGLYRMYCSPVVGDLNGDGYGEIAICYSNKAAVYDHKGFMLPGWPATFPGSAGEIRSIASSDVNNDGLFEIVVVKTASGPVTNVWSLAGQTVAGWPQVTDTANTG